MNLPPGFRARLIKSILNVFTQQEFRQFTMDYDIGIPYDNNIPPDVSFNSGIMLYIEQVLRHGRIEELMNAIHTERRNAAEIQNLYTEYKKDY